ncbi:MAG: phosphate ABC transporter substrate-binding/OmpA family protein [Phycisphaerae bacterium]|nr:phosphate ABC transporter substrate-binding/OmpA family protein [Phycisphaerae bacterium]MDW8260890.1 phosphate ABC transporter substrate-binding/OmpA family protein [Phycisphaerales bacterium]
MRHDQPAGLTGLGKFVSFLLIAGLICIGGYVYWAKTRPSGESGSVGEVSAHRPSEPPATDPGASRSPGAAAAAARGEDPATPDASGAALDLVETRRAPARLPAPQPYKMTGDVVDLELSEYAGYAGLIVANNGLEPNDDSMFARKHGFKLRIRLSEEESWPALNQGKMAASATTADVLAVYGRQFDVVVPAQIGFSRGADGVVVRSEIKRINQLKGQTLVTAQFTEADFFIRYLAQEAGLAVHMLPNLSARADPNKVNLVFAADAFTAGDVFLTALKNNDPRLAGCVTWAPKTTEVVEASDGRAVVLTTNRNLLIVADVLIVNRGFARENPRIVRGLVDGLLQDNRMVRENPDAHLEVIAKAFQWDQPTAKLELSKVHLSNGPENLAFFTGAIDAAGSFHGIYNSAVLAYGEVIRDPVDGDRFIDLTALKELESAGAFAGQSVAIAPIRGASPSGQLEVNPLLSKDIRFYFEPNSDELDGTRPENQKLLADIKKLLQISPGSTVLLRGHVDPGRIEEFRKQGGEELVRQQALRAMDLSKRRAARVKKLLVEQEKVEPARIDTVGRGWEEPAGKTQSENMRVEVQWFTLE